MSDLPDAVHPARALGFDKPPPGIRDVALLDQGHNFPLTPIEAAAAPVRATLALSSVTYRQAKQVGGAVRSLGNGFAFHL